MNNVRTRRFTRALAWFLCSILLVLGAWRLASARRSVALRQADDYTAGGAPSTVQPDPAIRSVIVPPGREPHLSHTQIVHLARQRVKYVFVLYQENRSFDSYFGDFPGAEGLFTRPPNQTPGFNQPILRTDGSTESIHPFRIGPDQFAADLDDTRHSHPELLEKEDIVSGLPRMDRFALAEESPRTPAGTPSLARRQIAELSMAYVDGDTIPFLWRWANRFTLFDKIFQLMTGPSGPGNLAVIGAQTGVTQWMLHPDQAFPGDAEQGPGVPVLSSSEPFWGSPLDPTKSGRIPSSAKDTKKDRANPKHVQRNLTYATVLLTLAKKQVREQTAADTHPDSDLQDVTEDIGAIARSRGSAVDWGWYQEGYDREPTDEHTGPLDAEGQHFSYIAHHNGPTFFGYVANNPNMRRHLHGLDELERALDAHTLSPNGGVYYLKGGLRNQLNLRPAAPDPRAQKTFMGDDDHPGDSDSQIAESMLADTINRIARSPYWNQCAIVIAWDDSAGQYDHVPPPIRSEGPDGAVLNDGPRIPLLVLSPFARAHTIVHDQGDHASIVKLVDELFDLKPLARLPAEERGREIGRLKYHQSNLGPSDADTASVTDLMGAFDPARLSGTVPPLPADYVEIPDQLIHTLPQAVSYGWRQVGVLPVDRQKGIVNAIPADFNPRPITEPTIVK